MGMELREALDRGAFDTRYLELLADLRRVCRAMGAGVDAEDVAQEALLDGRSHLHDLRDDSKLLPWLRRIAVRKALRGRQDAARRAQGHEEVRREFEFVDLAIDERVAVSRLGSRQRQLVQLVYFAGFRQEETAEMLGISRGTVAKTLWEARRALAHALADYKAGVSE